MTKARDLSLFGSIVSGLTGEIKMWPTSSSPSGYLLADGSAVSRTTYSSLFAIIGTTFGSGDGSTTFNLPNYTNRMPVGVGATGSLSITPGSVGGSANAAVISHTHTASTASAGGHTHTNDLGGSSVAGPYGSYGGSNSAEEGAGQPNNYLNSMQTAGAHTHTVTVDSAGSSGTNANMPPYLGIYFIIKT